jgi:hypothetical protein
MRKTLPVATIAVVVLVLFGAIKLIAAPSRTAAGIDTSAQSAISTYDLHTGYAGMKSLPVDEIPQP